MVKIKKLAWLGRSREDYRDFPRSVQDDAGYQLNLVQEGEEPFDWKPMPTIGKGVCEIRIKDMEGAFRVVYVASIGPAVYVLHAFKKKTQRTAKGDIDLAKDRYKQLVAELGK